MAEQVRTIGTNVDYQPVIRQRKGVQEPATGWCVGLQLPDTFAVLSQTELARGAEHALGELSTELPLLDPKPTRENGSDRGEGILLTRLDVCGPTHNVQPFSCSPIHQTHPQPVCVGVRAYFFDCSNKHVMQIRMERFNGIHCRSQHGESLGELFDLEGTTEKGLKPTPRDVHRTNCSRNRMSPS
jgi:hypothetical protein